jgi:hypothetical protein
MPERVDFASLPPAVRNFRPLCPGCTPTRLAIEGARPCSHYDCPGLPEELHVTCDICMYDFAAHDGQVKCDHTTCPTAIRLAANVPVYKAWVEMVVGEAEQRPK